MLSAEDFRRGQSFSTHLMDIYPRQLVPKLHRQFLYQVRSGQNLGLGCGRVRSSVSSRAPSEQGGLRACFQTIIQSQKKLVASGCKKAHLLLITRSPIFAFADVLVTTAIFDKSSIDGRRDRGRIRVVLRPNVGVGIGIIFLRHN